MSVLDPRTYGDGELQNIFRAVLKEEKDGTECDCRTCTGFNRLVREEAARRGLTGLPS